MLVLGVPILDRLFGRIPRGGRMLLMADPGTDGTSLLWQAAAARLTEGKPVVYVTWDRSPDRVRDALQRQGADPAQFGSLYIVDAHSGRFDAGEEAAYHIAEDARAAEVATVLREAAADHPDAWAYIDSFSGAHDRYGADRRAWLDVQEGLRGFQAAIGLFTAWPYLDAASGLGDGFDAVLRLEAVEDGIIRNQAFRVERLGWRTRYDRKARLVGTQAGRVEVVVPKLVVTGPQDAGKSTFIAAVSNRYESTERNGTTVALDRGQYETSGLKVEIWGTPGQARFDALLDNLMGGATGVLLLVDAADPDSFPRARELLARLQRHGLTTAIVANKQDQPNALGAEQLRDALDAPDQIPIIGCRATSKGDAEEALLLLLDSITEAR